MLKDTGQAGFPCFVMPDCWSYPLESCSKSSRWQIRDSSSLGNHSENSGVTQWAVDNFKWLVLKLDRHTSTSVISCDALFPFWLDDVDYNCKIFPPLFYLSCLPLLENSGYTYCSLTRSQKHIHRELYMLERHDPQRSVWANFYPLFLISPQKHARVAPCRL